MGAGNILIILVYLCNIRVSSSSLCWCSLRLDLVGGEVSGWNPVYYLLRLAEQLEELGGSSTPRARPFTSMLWRLAMFRLLQHDKAPTDLLSSQLLNEGTLYPKLTKDLGDCLQEGIFWSSGYFVRPVVWTNPIIKHYVKSSKQTEPRTTRVNILSACQPIDPDQYHDFGRGKQLFILNIRKITMYRSYFGNKRDYIIPVASRSGSISTTW